MIQQSLDLLIARVLPCLTVPPVLVADRKQVLLLRQILRANSLGQIRVGTVTDYQGQEEKIIIISTTLSQRHGMAAAAAARLRADAVERLRSREVAGAAVDDSSSAQPIAHASVGVGLFGDPKRFNVALTRAKALNVIVGDPHVWIADPFWQTLLEFCALHGAYRGCKLPKLNIDSDGLLDAETDVSTLLARAAESSLGASSEIYPTDIADFYNDDAGWRVML